jgi:hypothetical protein
MSVWSLSDGMETVFICILRLRGKNSVQTGKCKDGWWNGGLPSGSRRGTSVGLNRSDSPRILISTAAGRLHLALLKPGECDHSLYAGPIIASTTTRRAGLTFVKHSSTQILRSNSRNLATSRPRSPLPAVQPPLPFHSPAFVKVRHRTSSYFGWVPLPRRWLAQACVAERLGGARVDTAGSITWVW